MHIFKSLFKVSTHSSNIGSSYILGNAKVHYLKLYKHYALQSQKKCALIIFILLKYFLSDISCFVFWLAQFSKWFKYTPKCPSISPLIFRHTASPSQVLLWASFVIAIAGSLCHICCGTSRSFLFLSWLMPSFCWIISSRSFLRKGG